MSSTTQPPAGLDGEAPSSPSSTPAVLLRVQRACDVPDLPDDEQLASWVGAALLAGSTEPSPAAAVTLRFVDTAEGARLNETYRGRSGPTNVLSFPFEPPSGLPPEALAELGEDLDAELGDLAICAPVLRREAAEQGKALNAHTAHLVVHGTLHLLGYDHIEPAEAARMETLESAILRGLGFPTANEVPEDPDDHRSSA